MLTITSEQSTLTWEDIARYYGMTVQEFIRAQTPSVRKLIQDFGTGPMSSGVVPAGLRLRVPDLVTNREVREGKAPINPLSGQPVEPDRRRQNVFKNAQYIRRRGNARDTVENPETPSTPGAGGEEGETPPPSDVNNQPGAPTPDMPDGVDGSTGDPRADAESVVAGLNASFPWLEALGLTDPLISFLIENDRSTDEIVSWIRSTNQWQTQFVGIRRPDGTLRMREAEYMETRDSYRELLRQYGDPNYDYSSPEDFRSLFENDISTQEFGQRLELFDTLRRGPSDIRAAFFVYAGISLSDEDLYAYIVDPSRRADLDAAYNAQTSAQTLDYDTYIDRATSMGLDAVQRAVGNLRDAGVDTTGLENSILNMDQDEARNFVDLLNTGGTPGAALQLSELVAAFEIAAIGSAALGHGLLMASSDRIQEFRAAGVTRAQALQAYGDFARDRSALEAMVGRVRATGFSQSDFENATFLGSAEEESTLRAAVAQEQARSATVGAAAFDRDEFGRIRQSTMADTRNY